MAFSVCTQNCKVLRYVCTCEDESPCNDTQEISKPIAEELLSNLSGVRDTKEESTHWELTLHCETAAFRKTSPNLPLPSREARFYRHLYAAAAAHSRFYQKEVNHALLVTLAKNRRNRIFNKCIILSDQLLRLRSFDIVGRKIVIKQLEQFICKQTELESICLEGLSLMPAEGIRLMLALYNSRKTMKYVYCWRAFKRKEGPLVEIDHLAGPEFYACKIAKCDWFRAIGCLECLTTLSVNYAYIATPTGDLLINLSKKLGSKWMWLQLLCLEDEIPRDVELGNGGTASIPNTAWREAQSWAPALKIQYAIIGIPEYDRHKRFLARNTATHTFVLSTDIDFRFRQPWYIDCTIKTLCHWYSRTLVHLCLYFWHHREILDNQLRKLFVNLPSLEAFEFIGEIRKINTLCAMCCQIREEKCKVRCVNVQLQNVIHVKIDKEKWIKSLEYLLVCFKQDFDRMGVKFHIDFYPC